MRTIFLLLLLILVACSPVVAPTLEDPTPTREVWSVSCLPPEVFPLNSNPCLSYPQVVSLAPGTSQEYPRDFVVAMRPNPQGQNRFTDIVAVEEGYEIAMGSFDGVVAFQMHGIELAVNTLYAVNMDAYADFRDAPFWQGADSLRIVARIYTDNGEIIPLNIHSMVVGEAADATLSGIRPVHWTYCSDEPVTVVIEAGVEQIWAIARVGNFFRIEALYVHPIGQVVRCP